VYGVYGGGDQRLAARRLHPDAWHASPQLTWELQLFD
jgi:hypothetical protein